MKLGDKGNSVKERIESSNKIHNAKIIKKNHNMNNIIIE